MEFSADFDPSSGGSAGRPLKNPGVTFFHLAFRSLALFTYLFGQYFSSSFIGIFVFVVLMLSLDFWTVKNVTGRILVGLRWWNYIDDEGNSRWMFEARNGQSHVYLSKTEISIFWSALIAAPTLWLVFLLFAFFRFNFQWLILVVIGLSLSLSNLLGYLRCRMGRTDNVASAMSGMANAYMRNQVMGNITGLFSGGRAGGAAPATNMGADAQNII